jgi:outer membrane biosynthesis protein TonB
VAAKPKPVKEPRKTHEPKVATPTPADSDWKSAMSQLKKYSADKRNQVKASSILDASEKMSDPSPSGVSAVSPRRLEDSQDSLKVLGNRAAPTLSMDSTTPKNPQESLARVDVGNIRATVDLESSSTESTISGGLSKSQVQDLIRQNRNQIRNCYQKQLALKPKLQGRILYSWTILADGRVQDVEIKSFTLSSKEVRTCIQQVLRNLHYPASTNQMVTQVLYPFYLAPY